MQTALVQRLVPLARTVQAAAIVAHQHADFLAAQLLDAAHGVAGHQVADAGGIEAKQAEIPSQAGLGQLTHDSAADMCVKHN